MRKPRDFDAELQALEHRTRSLKERRLRQLGELVAATGADQLDAETLAGGLLVMMEVSDPARKESWPKRGQTFFQRRSRDTARSIPSHDVGAAADKGDPASA
jgi:DNA-binding protein H-NS